MRKAFLPIALLITLIVVMTSGSVALYTQTEVLRGQLYTRIFVLNGFEQTTSYEFGLSGLSLMPGEGEKELYRFTLTNAQGSSDISDYNMNITIASDGMASAINAMDGLVFYLYNLSVEGSSPVATITGGELSYEGLSFRAGVQKSVQYKLTARWADTGASEAQTALAANGTRLPITIAVTATASN